MYMSLIDCGESQETGNACRLQNLLSFLEPVHYRTILTKMLKIQDPYFHIPYFFVKESENCQENERK